MLKKKSDKTPKFLLQRSQVSLSGECQHVFKLSAFRSSALLSFCTPFKGRFNKLICCIKRGEKISRNPVALHYVKNENNEWFEEVLVMGGI